MSAIEPLIKRKLFATEEDAINQLVSDYVLRQISDAQTELSAFEHKYGMTFQQFEEYLHDRSLLLTEGEFTDEQRRVLGRLVMEEEDDWLEWKAMKEILESWLGLRAETEQ